MAPSMATTMNLDPMGSDHPVAAADDLGVFTKKLIPFDRMTTFSAKWIEENGDITFQFFQTAERPGRDYWQKHFPIALEKAAMAYFGAGRPTVEAAFVPEAASWWMRTRGFGHVVNLEAFVTAFFEKLDQEIEGTS